MTAVPGFQYRLFFYCPSHGGRALCRAGGEAARWNSSPATAPCHLTFTASSQSVQWT